MIFKSTAKNATPRHHSRVEGYTPIPLLTSLHFCFLTTLTLCYFDNLYTAHVEVIFFKMLKKDKHSCMCKYSMYILIHNY